MTARGLSVIAVLCTIAIGACGSRASAGTYARHSVRVRAASCPTGGEKTILGLIPRRGSGGLLAPDGTLWTTFCRGTSTRVLKGGPIDAALNTARYRPNETCVTNLEVPILVILRSRTETRRFIINMDGCPGVVISDATKLSFTPPGIEQVSAALVKSRLVVRGAGARTPKTAAPLAIARFVARTDRAMSQRFTASYHVALFKFRGRIFHGDVSVTQIPGTGAAFRERPGFLAFGDTYEYELFSGARFYVSCDRAHPHSRWLCLSEVGEGMGSMSAQNDEAIPQAFTAGMDEAVSDYGSPALLVPAQAAKYTAPVPIFLSTRKVNGRAEECLSIGNPGGAVGLVCTTRSGVIVSYRLATRQGDNDYASAQLVSYTTEVNPNALVPPTKPVEPGA